jgi:putative exporter of polyketide antibiotics
MVISIALIIMSIILFVKSIISPELSGWLKQIKIKNVIIIAVGVAIYVIAIPILGIIVASTVYIIAFSLVAAPEVNKATVATSIIVAVGVSASFSYVFIKYFYVPLPSGLFS